MKINNGKGVQLTGLYQRRLEDKRNGKAVSQDMPAADSLAISGEAAKLGELMKAAALPADVRAERVRQIKDAIDRGEYILDSKKLAEAMLSSGKAE